MQRVGSWFLPEREKHLVKYIERDDAYQQAERDHALAFVQCHSEAIDIGAHVGLWARDLGNHFDMVHCFEPIPHHFMCLLANLPNTTDKYRFYRQALGEREGTLQIDVDDSCTGAAHVAETGQVVPCAKLDDFRFGQIGFIKIDCEGYEGPVLRGSKLTLLRHKPIINIEQKQKKKGSLYQGAGRKAFEGCEVLESYGAKLLSQFKSEYVFGW